MNVMFPCPLVVLLVTKVCIALELFVIPTPLRVSLKVGFGAMRLAVMV